MRTAVGIAFQKYTPSVRIKSEVYIRLNDLRTSVTSFQLTHPFCSSAIVIKTALLTTIWAILADYDLVIYYSVCIKY